MLQIWLCYVIRRKGFHKFMYFAIRLYIVASLQMLDRIWWKFNTSWCEIFLSRSKKPSRFQIWCQNRHVRPPKPDSVWACARLGGGNAYCKVIFLAHLRKHCCAKLTLQRSWIPTLCWWLFSNVWSDCVSLQPQQWIWMGWWVKVRICWNSWGTFLSSAKLYVSLILIGQLQCVYVARNNTLFAQKVSFNVFGLQAST